MIRSWSATVLFNFQNPEKYSSRIRRTDRILQMGWKKRGLAEAVGEQWKRMVCVEEGGEVGKPLLEIKSENNARKIRGERWEKREK